VLVGDDDTAVGGGQLQGPLDDLVRLAAAAHRPASCVVFGLCLPGGRPPDPRRGAVWADGAFIDRPPAWCSGW
jgi:hypothetical protein